MAGLVWERFGKVDRYIEPFAGSLAVLLAAPEPAPKEVVSDTNGYIVNFWRSVQNDPDAVAYHAEYPTLHHDLTARQHTLWEWYLNSDQLLTDPHYYDTQVAGWWVWGTSNYIAGNYAMKSSGFTDDVPQLPHTKHGARGVAQGRVKGGVFTEGRPHVTKKLLGGQGIQASRESFNDKRPHVYPHHEKGLGVSSGAKLSEFHDKRPNVFALRTGGQGVSASSAHFQDNRPHIRSHKQGGQGVGISTDLQDGVTTNAGYIPPADPDMELPDCYESWMRIEIFHYMRQLQARLRRVTTLNRPFGSFITPTIAGFTKTVKLDTAIFLDPPYRTEARTETLYSSDLDGTSDDVAVESYEWAVANGQDFKIAYCMHEGDFPVPDGWSSHEVRFAGHHSQSTKANRRLDQIIFSPRCDRTATQESLFGD